MRLASFNVENLFSRARAMNMADWEAGREILTAYSQLSSLLQKEDYADSKDAILAAIEKLDLSHSDESDYVILRQNKGRLLKRAQTEPPEVVAAGRGDWVGWLELKTEAVNDVAVQMTAKVIKDVGADVLAVIEAENRIALSYFNEQLLKPLDGRYSGIMLIDGNDERGIDVGILLKEGCQLERIVSHVDDMANGCRIFSRDCPEYLVNCGDKQVLVLVNHLKSKGYGSQAQSDKRRKQQAQRVRDVYDLRRSQGQQLIAIVGDFNDTPDSDALSPLLADGCDVMDIFEHPKFEGDGRPGTYGNGAKSNKIDYILLSPELSHAVTKAGVWRKGVWGGSHGTLFPHYDEMTKAAHAASDHAAIWVDLDL